MRFSSYSQAVHYLIHEMPKTPRDVFKDSDALEKNRRLARLFDNPQDTHPSIHIAGTSGKGSVCYQVDSILRAHDCRAGMLVSPHVYEIRERVQILGAMISEKLFMRLLEEVTDKMTSTHEKISYFEANTVIGFLALASKSLDYQVIETGMGGRLDATNVITRTDKLCVLTQIGFDHMDALGNTLPEIAAQKAGIIQPGNHVIALRQAEEVMSIFEKRVAEVDATIEWVEAAQEYEITNRRIAEAVCRFLANRDGWFYDENLASQALGNLAIPGRFEKRLIDGQWIILDGAHNPQKLAALSSRLVREDIASVTFVFAIGDRKDVDQAIATIAPLAKRVYTTEFFTDAQDIPKRPVSSEELAQKFRDIGIRAEAIIHPQDALKAARQHEDTIVVTGSFYLLGELDKYIR